MAQTARKTTGKGKAGRPVGHRPAGHRPDDYLFDRELDQLITRAERSSFFGREVSRDLTGNLRGAGFIASGPRSPTPGATYTYVTTRHFLSAFGLATLRDLPDMEKLEDAGLLDKEKLLADVSGAPGMLGDEVLAEEHDQP